MKLFTGYGDDPKARAAVKAGCAIKCEDDSLTVQSDRESSDINFIMRNYHRTGQLPPVSRLPSFGDFDGVADFREALEVVREAEHQFMQLPAQVRARFDNDAVQFVEFCDNPSNLPELVGLGILDPTLEGEIRARIAKAQEVKENPTDGKSGGSTPAKS